MTRRIRNDGRPIDLEERLGDLERTLREDPGIVAAYVYGSYGTSNQTPLSDVDLAVLYRDDKIPDPDAHLRLIGRVTDTLDEDDVSVTILNQAPILSQREVLRQGRPLFVADDIAHADFVETVIDRAADFEIDHRRFRREYDTALIEDHGTRRPR